MSHSDFNFTITPASPSSVFVTPATWQMAQSIRGTLDHALARPRHGEECGYCSARNARHKAAESRRSRYLDRLKRICLTNPSPRALDAYVDALRDEWD